MNRYLTKMVLLFCILLQATNGPFAQQPVFRNLFPTENFASVPDIVQDAKGFMWFACAGSLVMYNGYSLTYYKNDSKNSNSLGGQRVECLYADKEGMIWIGFMGSGLDRFNPATGIFTHFRHDPNNKLSIGHDLVASLFEDRDGNFWIGTHGGLDKLDKKTGIFTHYVHRRDDTASISNDQVRAIYQDRAGTLWLGTGSPWNIGLQSGLPGESGVEGEGGLNKMDVKTGRFTRYMNDPKKENSLINNKVRALFEDKAGNFWVGTAGDGLHTMDRKAGTFSTLSL